MAVCENSIGCKIGISVAIALVACVAVFCIAYFSRSKRLRQAKARDAQLEAALDNDNDDDGMVEMVGGIAVPAQPRPAVMKKPSTTAKSPLGLNGSGSGSDDDGGSHEKVPLGGEGKMG